MINLTAGKHLTEEILETSSELGVSVIELSPQRVQEAASLGESTFGVPRAETRCLWERLGPQRYWHDHEALLKLQDVRVPGGVIAWYGDECAPDGVAFQSLSDLARVFWDCTGFVFYAIDERAQFLVCINDHDVITVCGSLVDEVALKYQE